MHCWEPLGQWEGMGVAQVRVGGSHGCCARRCPGLSLYVSPVIPAYNAVVFLFVLANFSMATFMDPGIFPRGESGSSQEELPPYTLPWS